MHADFCKMANCREYEDLDLASYEKARRHLEEVGFRFLGDLEFTNRPGIPQRVMLNEECTVIAWLWSPFQEGTTKLINRFLRPGKQALVDFRTEFSNGVFLNTTSHGIEIPAGFSGKIFHHWGPEKAMPLDVFRYHLRNLEHHNKKNENIFPQKHLTLADVIASRKRQEQILKPLHMEKLSPSNPAPEILSTSPLPGSD